MSNISIELELKKLGLDEKEARLYLICLEARHSSVQNIAKTAGLSRPTTYRVIESLLKKGLVTREKKNRKNSLIAAESPDKILGLLRAQKRRVEEQEREFLRIISSLNSKYYSDSKNEIRTYSGEKGLDFLLNDFSNTLSKQIDIAFLKNSEAENEKLAVIYKNLHRRLGKIKIREFWKNNFPETKSNYIQRKKIPITFPLSPGILILSDKLIYLEKNQGFVVENKKVVSLVKNFFEGMWESS